MTNETKQFIVQCAKHAQCAMLVHMKNAIDERRMQTILHDDIIEQIWEAYNKNIDEYMIISMHEYTNMHRVISRATFKRIVNDIVERTIDAIDDPMLIDASEITQTIFDDMIDEL